MIIAQIPPKMTNLIVGTYTKGSSEGIYSLKFNIQTGEITENSIAKKLKNPLLVTLEEIESQNSVIEVLDSKLLFETCKAILKAKNEGFLNINQLKHAKAAGAFSYWTNSYSSDTLRSFFVVSSYRKDSRKRSCSNTTM